MASPPKCKICGSAHWGGQPHAFPKPVHVGVDLASEPDRTVGVEVRATPRGIKFVREVPPEELARLIALDDRERARKEKAATYMRKYRAAQKGEGKKR